MKLTAENWASPEAMTDALHTGGINPSSGKVQVVHLTLPPKDARVGLDIHQVFLDAETVMNRDRPLGAFTTGIVNGLDFGAQVYICRNLAMHDNARHGGASVSDIPSE